MIGSNLTNIFKHVSLPKDIGPHAFTDVEWWYYYAFLDGEFGGKYAVIAAFYQAGELPVFKGHYLIFSLIDLSKCTSQSFSLIDKKMADNIIYINTPAYLLQCPDDKNVKNLWRHLILGKLPSPHQWLSNASIEESPTGLFYDDSFMIFKDSKDGQFKTKVSSKGISATLEFNSIKPVSLIGGTGKPDKLYYYSFPCNEVRGYIEKNQSRESVLGEGWFDHQWGYRGDLITKTGWNWFGLQLDDGRELLINEFRTIKTGNTFSPMANLIEKNGELRVTRNVSFQPSNYWRSPITNALYPLRWIISIPEFYMTIEVSAVFKKQEMPVIAPLNAIWEGACIVSGTETKSNFRIKPLRGKGFLELVGYANFKC